MYTNTLENPQASQHRFGAPLLIRGLLVALILSISASSGFADEIYFKSGYSETGVVTRETDDSITFRSEMGISTISKEKIEFIEKAAPEENHRLLKEWREKTQQRKAEAEATKEAERKFEQKQMAKGLVKFEGTWVTPAQKQKILDLRKQAVKHRRKFEAEQRAKGLVLFEHIWVSPEIADELAEMESEIYRLNNEILDQEKMIDSLRSAMLNVNSIEDAEGFSARIEETIKSMNTNIKKLNKLLERADEIEATSVTYKIPEKFLDALPVEETEEMEEDEFE